MVAFDFDAALRWARFGSNGTLARRKDDELPFLGDVATAGQELLLDTTVYIDGMQGRTPDVISHLLRARVVNHSTVAVEELMHAVGALDRHHPGTKAAIGQIAIAIKGMRPHRLFAPDPDVLGRAALLSGILSRLQGHGAADRFRTLHDCILFLQAQKLGFTVLTANVSDFDFLLQLVPTGRVLLYRQTRSSH